MHTKEFKTFGRPTITVVMPVYNVAQYIERCLQSVMLQSYPATECIIIDDVSTDDSIELCQRLIDEYSGPTQFIVLHHNRNRGLSAARNTGTDAATSDYIYYLDSDDEITQDCLEKLVAPVMRDDSIEMVMGGFRYDYSLMPGKKYQFEQKVRNWFLTKESNYMHNEPLELHTNEEVRRWFYHGKSPRPNMVWNKLLKLSFVRENQLYNKEGRLYEECLWTINLMRPIKHAVIVSDVTYAYYQRKGSIMSETKYEERIRHFGYTFREISEQIVPGERIEEIKWILSFFCHYYIDASDNPDYQYAYNAYRRQLDDGRYWRSVIRLTLTHYIAMSRVGRIAFKLLTKGQKWSVLLFRVFF